MVAIDLNRMRLVGKLDVETYRTCKNLWRNNPILRKYRFPLIAFDSDDIRVEDSWKFVQKN